MLVHAYKEELKESILSLLWRQWVGVGVAGHGRSSGSEIVVDPESLIIATSIFGRYDQRMYDLMISWLIRYGALVNTTRLKALLNRSKYKDKASVGYIAALCEMSGDKRWSRFAAEYKRTHQEPEYLFEDTDGAGYVREADPLALQYGFRRNTYIRQNKVLQSIPDTTSSLLLRLRGLFGVNARADVFLLLLQEPRSLLQLAEGCGYTRGTIIEILREWELGQIVSRIPYSAKRDLYCIKQVEIIKKYCGVETVLYPMWNSIFDAIIALWQLVSQPAMQKVSPKTFVGELTLLNKEQILPILSRCGIQVLSELTEKSLLEAPSLLEKL